MQNSLEQVMLKYISTIHENGNSERLDLKGNLRISLNDFRTFMEMHQKYKLSLDDCRELIKSLDETVDETSMSFQGTTVFIMRLIKLEM